METKKECYELDFIKLFKQLYFKRKYIFIHTSITFIIGCIIAFSIPKQYSAKVILSPESGVNTSNNLSNMASMFGLGSLGGKNEDALTPNMIPDIIQSTPFILELYPIKVKTKDNNKVTFTEFLENQRKPWWNYIIQLPSLVTNQTIKLFQKRDIKRDSIEGRLDIFKLTPKQYSNIQRIKSIVTASIDKKTGMTEINVTLQDPIIAATIADSVTYKIQKFLTNYRIQKALDDYNYLNQLAKERRIEYYNAQDKYAKYNDANRNINMQRTQAEATRLENNMNIAYQVYSQIETQLQVARAKLQEAKPIFAIIEPASVPLYPIFPNKAIIIIIFTFLGCTCSICWILFAKELFNYLYKQFKYK